MKSRIPNLFIGALLLALAACRGTEIGPAGGTVIGPNGTSVVIPAGALASSTRILITPVASGAPPLPTGHTAGGQIFAFTPHGTTFAVPVTMTIPFDPALVPAGRTPAFFKTNAQNQWEKIPNAVFGATSVSAQVSSFSVATWLTEPLFIGKPTFEWEIKELKGEDLVELQVDERIADSGGVAAHYDFGGAARDADVYSFDGTLVVASDGIATAQIAATADGSDWWVGTEAPIGITGAPNNTIGTVAEFKQTQSYIKRTGDAMLSFKVIEAFMETSDANLSLDRGCPPGHVKGDVCDAVSAQLFFEAKAFKPPSDLPDLFDYFYHLGGGAQITGIAGNWTTTAHTAAFSREKLWDIGDFEIDVSSIDEHREALVTMKLAHPIFHEYFIDLSSVEVGQAFTLQLSATATAYNRAASAIKNRGPEFETSARAYLRDPRVPQGMTVTFAGLEPIETEQPLELPPEVPIEPAACVPGPGPNPEAGTLQFDAPDYLQLESNVVPSVTVTRTGGSVGDVTATFSTSDGSAIAGVDYTALAMTVFFEDGDNTPRVVPVNAIRDSTPDEPDKTVNLTLSQPGGCAALGAQTTAVLTIQDDDLPPPPPSFTVGGTVTGLIGTGLTLQDHHFLQLTPGNGPFTFTLPTQSGEPYAVTIVTQPSNPVQVCSISNASGTMGNANVTNVNVACSPPPTPGGLDPGFGGGTGKVSSGFGGDETDMLLQSDGKILMIGGSSTDFIMARYDTDGSLDETFGATGLVTTDIAGGLDAALGGALLPDGRIVVVGSARVGGNDDFAIVRYLPNGGVDTSFGTQGKTTTDFFGQRDRAFAVAVQPDNGIVVVGDALGVGISDFAIARYDANGVLDTSFGGNGTGTRTTDIAQRVDIAKNVVIDGSGSILVTGTITIGTSPVLGHTGLARYTSAGLPDPSFNLVGTLTINLMNLGEGLALQPDGRILVMGHAAVGGRANFAVERLMPNGVADGSFGLGGLTTVGFSIQDDYGRDIALDAEGRILLSGQTSNLSNPDFAVTRLTSTGALDTSFGTDGKFTVDFFNASDSAENVAVQADGKIVLGGFGVNGTSVRYGLARINP